MNRRLALFPILLAASAHGAIVLSDDFSGSGSALNGTTTDVGGLTWTAGAVFKDNGNVDTLVSATANGQSAYLPYDITTGQIYTLTATITNPFSDWIAVGFSTTANNTTATIFSARHSNSGAYGWILARDSASAGQDVQFFDGAGTAGGANGTNVAGLTLSVFTNTFKIVLDTTGTDTTAAYFMNGVQQGTTQVLGNSVTVANALTGVGFSRDRIASGSTGGSIDSLTLDVVPEPATAFLGGLGLLGLLRRRRA